MRKYDNEIAEIGKTITRLEKENVTRDDFFDDPERALKKIGLWSDVVSKLNQFDDEISSLGEQATLLVDLAGDEIDPDQGDAWDAEMDRLRRKFPWVWDYL
jgi:hypothetical protein